MNNLSSARTWWGRGRAIAVALAAIAALVATFALSGVSDAAGNLTFGDAPTGWSVTSGEADGNIGKVQASGVKKKRIRYSISGASGFSVKGKTGVVSYDGSAISPDVTEALLTVTARDRKGKVSDASVTITVSIAQAQPEPQLQRQTPDPQPQIIPPHDHAEELKIYHAKLVRRHYRDGESHGRPAGYYTTLEPAGSLHIPKAYEGNSVSGSHRGVAFVESNESQVKWTIDGDSMKYGFKLGRLGGSSYESLSKPMGDSAQKIIAYNNAGSKSSTEQAIAVHYDGTKWPGEGYGSGTLGYTHEIEVTGTDHMGRQITVTIEVCLSRSS